MKVKMSSGKLRRIYCPSVLPLGISERQSIKKLIWQSMSRKALEAAQHPLNTVSAGLAGATK